MSRSSRRVADVILVSVVAVGAILRLWDLGSTPLSIDESYSALAARLPWADLVGHIDATDPHGPLAYILVKPVASLTAEIGSMRAVSALASTGALLVMAVWQRREGVAGLVATVIFAVAPFQLFFPRQIRMYGLLALLGVLAAWSAQRWLQAPGRRSVAVMAAAGLAASLTHATGPILLGGLVLVPGLRRDRAAWELRVAVAVAGSAFALLWGAHTIRWGGSSWFPPVTPDWASIVANETIAPVPGNRWLLLPLVAAGAITLLRARGPLARVWLCLFVAPFAVLYMASLEHGILVPKSLVLFSWALPVALGALCGWLSNRSHALGAATVAAIALLLVPYIGKSMHQDEGAGTAADSLFASAAPQDGFAFWPGTWQFDSLLGWYGDMEDARPTSGPETVAGLDVYWSQVDERSGRAWFLATADQEVPQGLRVCSDVQEYGLFTAQCIELPDAIAAP